MFDSKLYGGTVTLYERISAQCTCKQMIIAFCVYGTFVPCCFKLVTSRD
jgi:hypothetical protein